MEGIGLNFRDLLRLHVRNFIFVPQIRFSVPFNGFCILLFHVFVTVRAYESWIAEYSGYGSFIICRIYSWTRSHGIFCS
jgi:hypothetical protein